MKEFLTALCFLAVGTVLSAAKPLDREETQRLLNHSNPPAARQIAPQPPALPPQRFASQQMAKPPLKPKRVSRNARKMRAYQMPAYQAQPKMRAYQTQPLPESKLPGESPVMRPGRNYDNPAANRFGDGSLPNKYIWGSGR